jgi:S-adenosylmethionine:tRNA ribosyltransferase-isomerase
VRTSDFDYTLDPELSAQSPLPERDASRMLVVDRRFGTLTHSRIIDLPSFVAPGDMVVVNNSRVLAARISAKRVPSGGRVEILLLSRESGGVWQALVKPARRLKSGEFLEIYSGPRITVQQKLDEGLALLELPEELAMNLDRYGQAPLPPYIHAPLFDNERYQTIYASLPGSAAAPTAGLHFTNDLRRRLGDAGAGWVEVTLHIGLDTFRPVTAERVQDHRMHSEWCQVSDEAAKAIAETRRSGGKIIAVGTTAARTLETAGGKWNGKEARGFQTSTRLFITPGYSWKIVDCLLTNFHLPKSTLLMMVSSFGGRETILNAYQVASRDRYRFCSFGDAMLIL